MITTTLSNQSKPQHPAVEACLKNLHIELNDFVEIEAKEDAKKQPELQEPIFKLKIESPIHAKVEISIAFIEQTLLTTSQILDAKERDQIVNKRKLELDIETNQHLHKIAELKRKLGGIFIDPQKVKYGKPFMFMAILVALADGSLAFFNFRAAYSPWTAIIPAVAVFIVIGFSHLLYSRLINEAPTPSKKLSRIVSILSIAAVFFCGMGVLRSSAINQTVNIDLGGDNVVAHTVAHLNGLSIAIISFVLFIVVFFLSLFLWKSEKEKQDEQDHTCLSNELLRVEQELTLLTTEKNTIEQQVYIQKSEARKWFEYGARSITKCKSIGKYAIANYKDKYVRYRNNCAPSYFFSEDTTSFNGPANFFSRIKPDSI